MNKHKIKNLKYTWIAFFIAILITSCNSGTIEVDTYLMVRYHKKTIPITIDSLGGKFETFKVLYDQREVTGYIFLPPKGLRITIDTVNKSLLIPFYALEFPYKEGSPLTFVTINKENIRFSNWEKYSPHTITAWRNSPDSGLVLQTRYEEKDYLCRLKDSIFTIQSDNLEDFVFIGHKNTKEISKSYDKEMKKSSLYKLTKAAESI